MNDLGVLGFLRCLYQYARPYRAHAALICLGLLLEMAFNAAVPISFKFLIDRALLGQDRRALLLILGGLALAVMLVSVVGLGRDYLYAKVVAEMLGNLRERLFGHLQKLALEFYGRTQAGETLARFSGDIASVEQALTAAVSWAVLPGLDVGLSTVLLFVLDWRLALVAMLVWPMSLLGPRWFGPPASQASYERKLEEAEAISYVQENIAAQPVVKAFGLEAKSQAGFRKRNTALVRRSLRLSFLSALVERSASVGINILQVGILGVGAWLVIKNQMTIGSLAAFQTLFMMLSASLSYVTQYIPSLVGASGAMRHINVLLEESPRVLDAPEAFELPRLRKEIAFQDVNFSYTGKELNLNQVTLRIPQSASVAFVGPSGCGKSTMINLAMRFYDPTSGAILMDGHDLRRMTQQSVRRQIGVVFQDSFLFNATVRENIRLGKPGATDEEIERAAMAAEIHDVIMSWPERYNTPVGERGGRLSGGQRQRIAIARGIVSDPAILILDEATSALDPGTEAAVNATLAEVGKGRTVISVTHRLASVVNSDCIFVFDKGRLVERGRHGDLLQARGLYSQLWEKQAGFTISEAGDRAELSAAKLQQLPILAKLPPALQAEVAELFVSEQYPKDRVVFYQGDPGDRFYLIARGKVVVYRTSPSGEERPVATLVDGDYFGEIALLKNVPRTASVRTLLPSLFLTLRREQFLDLLNRDPDLRAEIIATADLRGQTSEEQ